MRVSTARWIFAGEKTVKFVAAGIKLQRFAWQMFCRGAFTQGLAPRFDIGNEGDAVFLLLGNFGQGLAHGDKAFCRWRMTAAPLNRDGILRAHAPPEGFRRGGIKTGADR